MMNLTQIVNGNLVIELTPAMIEALLNHAPDTGFVSKEDKDLDSESFEDLTVITDINEFLPAIVGEMNSEDEIGLTILLRTIIKAAYNAVDNGEMEGCDID